MAKLQLIHNNQVTLFFLLLLSLVCGWIFFFVLPTSFTVRIGFSLSIALWAFFFSRLFFSTLRSLLVFTCILLFFSSTALVQFSLINLLLATVILVGGLYLIP